MVLEKSSPLCRSKGAKCLSLAINGEEVLSKVTLHRDEVMVLPAPNVLGHRQHGILGTAVSSSGKHCGGGDRCGCPSTLPRSTFSSSEKPSPTRGRNLSVDDALAWVMRQNSSAFDAIVVNLCRELWRQASRTSRVPRTRRFMRKLSSLFAPGGIIPCRTSATLRHRVTPGDYWTCIGTVLLQCGPCLTGIRHKNWTPMKH